ncbi:MAG: putative motility protein [Turicibacter sp.]|nr:putative motility protein [Turicibacter sp.]
MEIGANGTSNNDNVNVMEQVGIRMLDRTLDQMELVGEQLVQMMDAAAITAATGEGGLLNITV